MGSWAWGFSHGVRVAPVASFVISELFASGEQGVWYDTNDLATLWQDTAGTVPVTAAGQLVARVDDKSGNGHHVLQVDSAKRPILRLNATTGTYYLEFDGIDDMMSTAAAVDFSAYNTLTMFAGVRKLASTSGSIIGLGRNDPGSALLYAAGTASDDFSPVIYAPSGTGLSLRTYTAPISAVLSVVCDTSKTGVANEITARINGATPPTIVPLGAADSATFNFANLPITAGALNTGASPFNGHIYSLVMVSRVANAAEISGIEHLFAAATGVTLA